MEPVNCNKIYETLPCRKDYDIPREYFHQKTGRARNLSPSLRTTVYKSEDPSSELWEAWNLYSFQPVRSGAVGSSAAALQSRAEQSRGLICPASQQPKLGAAIARFVLVPEPAHLRLTGIRWPQDSPQVSLWLQCRQIPVFWPGLFSFRVTTETPIQQNDPITHLAKRSASRSP